MIEVKEFFDSRSIKYKEIFTAEGTILTKLMKLIYLMDYTSIYRAVLSNIDPSPIESIEFVKSRI